MTGPIVFDGSVLAAGPITGVGGSFLSTLAAYVAIAEHPCILALPRGGFDAGESIPGLQIEAVLPPARLRRRRHLRRFVHRHGAALLHSPVVTLPPRLRCPTVATVHDIPWLHPELHGEPGTRFLQRLALRRALRLADALIVPSTATEADLAKVARTPPRRVERIPHGVHRPEQPADDNPTGAFLVLGDARPRKNLDRLQRAHHLARSQCPDLPDLHLVGPGHRYVSEAAKWTLLRSARALVHVALFEGFGLPVLEAMAHGIPVVCSNRSSLPEVAGDAALLVDPTDIEAIATALVRVHRDQPLRATLRERGRQHSAAFTPAATATAWLHLHHHLMT